MKKWLQLLPLIFLLSISVIAFTGCKKSAKEVCIEGCNESFKTSMRNCIIDYAVCLRQAGDDEGAKDECKIVLKDCIEYLNELREDCVEVCNGL